MLKIGAFLETGGADIETLPGYIPEVVGAFEAMQMRRLDYLVTFGGIMQPFPINRCNELLSRGTTPIISYQPVAYGERPNRRDSTAYAAGTVVKVAGFTPMLTHLQGSVHHGVTISKDVYTTFRSFRCIQGGTTASSLPSNFTSTPVAGTVTDGSVTWIRMQDTEVSAPSLLTAIGDFNTDTNGDGLADGWSKAGTFSHSLSTEADGTKSQRIHHTATTAGTRVLFTTDTYPAAAGAWYRVRFRVKGSHPGCEPYVGFDALDAQGNVIQSLDGPSFTAGTSHAFYNHFAITPAGTVAIRPKLGIKFVDAGDSFDLYINSALAQRADWAPWAEYNWDTVTAGVWDHRFIARANELAQMNGQVIVRYNHEFNLTWPVWADELSTTSARWVDIYKRFVDVVKPIAPNARFMWCPNNRYLNSAGFGITNNYYPGSSYVDYVGIDGYNWPSYDTGGSFDHVFLDSYSQIVQHQKPVILAETASAPKNKAAYIRQMFEAIQTRYPLIEGICWFNVNKEYDWRVEMDSAALTEWRRYVSLAAVDGISPILLMDRNRQVIRQIHEYESLVTDHKWAQHSEWSGKFPLSEHASLEAAYFMMVQGDRRVYLVEKVQAHEKVTADGDPHVEAAGREATALLHTRTITKTLRRSNDTRLGLASTLFWHLDNTSRNIGGLAMDYTMSVNGDTVPDWQRSWGDVGDIFLDICEAGGLGFSTYLDGANIIRIVLEAPAESSKRVGAAYGNATGARLVRDMSEWRNYAYVLGEGEGAERRQVIVDLRAGQERRELYVDARDLQKTVDNTTYTDAQYDAMLAQRGREKLAETRYIEFAEATSSAPIRCGDVVWYDTERWAGWLMVTEVSVVREGGDTRRDVRLGEPPNSFSKIIHRLKRRV